MAQDGQPQDLGPPRLELRPAAPPWRFRYRRCAPDGRRRRPAPWRRRACAGSCRAPPGWGWAPATGAPSARGRRPASVPMPTTITSWAARRAWVSASDSLPLRRYGLPLSSAMLPSRLCAQARVTNGLPLRASARSALRRSSSTRPITSAVECGLVRLTPCPLVVTLWRPKGCQSRRGDFRLQPRREPPHRANGSCFALPGRGSLSTTFSDDEASTRGSAAAASAFGPARMNMVRSSSKTATFIRIAKKGATRCERRTEKHDQDLARSRRWSRRLYAGAAGVRNFALKSHELADATCNVSTKLGVTVDGPRAAVAPSTRPHSHASVRPICGSNRRPGNVPTEWTGRPPPTAAGRAPRRAGRTAAAARGPGPAGAGRRPRSARPSVRRLVHSGRTSARAATQPAWLAGSRASRPSIPAEAPRPQRRAAGASAVAVCGRRRRPGRAVSRR